PPGVQRSGRPKLHQADPGPRSEDGEDALLEPASRVLHPRRAARATPATAGSSRTSAVSGGSRELGEAQGRQARAPAAAPVPSSSTTTGGRARGRPKAGNLGGLHPRRAARATPATAGSSRTSAVSGGSRELGEAQ